MGVDGFLIRSRGDQSEETKEHSHQQGESIKGKVKSRDRNQHGGQRCSSIADKAEGAGGRGSRT